MTSTNSNTSPDEQDKRKTRKEKLAGFFYNIAQLTFAGLVIGGVTPLLGKDPNTTNWISVILGFGFTAIYAYFTNRILKY